MAMRFSGLLAALGAVAVLAGCAYPTETARTIDNRPQIMFKTTHDSDRMVVYVDGIQNGVVSNYLDGKAALRVLPGTHTITIKMPDGSVNTQKVFVTDGVTKTIVVQ